MRWSLYRSGELVEVLACRVHTWGVPAPIVVRRRVSRRRLVVAALVPLLPCSRCVWRRCHWTGNGVSILLLLAMRRRAGRWIRMTRTVSGKRLRARERKTISSIQSHDPMRPVCAHLGCMTPGLCFDHICPSRRWIARCVTEGKTVAMGSGHSSNPLPFWPQLLAHADRRHTSSFIAMVKKQREGRQGEGWQGCRQTGLETLGEEGAGLGP